MSQRGMHMLVEKNLLLEVKNVQLEKCIDYLAGRKKKLTLCPRPMMRRKNSLELVHIDVCYVDSKSHVGAEYFVTFIDVYD